MLVRSSQEQWSRSTSPECSKSAPDFMMSIQELSGALRSTRSGWAGVHLPECSRFHDEHPGALRSPQEHQEQLSRSASPRVLPECSQADCVLEKFTEERGARLKKSPSNYQESVSLIKVFHLEMESGPLPLLHLIVLSACLCTFPLVFITLSKSIH